MKRDCLGPHLYAQLDAAPNLQAQRKGCAANFIAANSYPRRCSVDPHGRRRGAKKVLEMTQNLVAEAPDGIKDRVWLYRSSRRGDRKGQILCLNTGSVYEKTKSIVRRHRLFADDGSALRVTLGRLRKTMENRLWKLSDGDLLAVSAVMGHSPQVADNHYLRLDERTKAEGAKFIGEALPGKLRGTASFPPPRAVARTACKVRSLRRMAPHIARSSRIAWGVRAMPLWGQSRTCTGSSVSGAS